MDYSIQTVRSGESVGGMIVDSSLPLPAGAEPSLLPYRVNGGLSPALNPFTLDRKKWGALLAESSDHIEEAEFEVEDYRRQNHLDRALAKFSEAAGLANCLNKRAKSFFHVLWTYLGNPALLTNDAACRILKRIIRDFAGHPNATEKDVERYQGDIDGADLDFTWISQGGDAK